MNKNATLLAALTLWGSALSCHAELAALGEEELASTGAQGGLKVQFDFRYNYDANGVATGDANTRKVMLWVEPHQRWLVFHNAKASVSGAFTLDSEVYDGKEALKVAFPAPLNITDLGFEQATIEIYPRTPSATDYAAAPVNGNIIGITAGGTLNINGGMYLFQK